MLEKKLKLRYINYTEMVSNSTVHVFVPEVDTSKTSRL